MGLLLRNIRVPRGLIFAAELGLETGSRKKSPHGVTPETAANTLSGAGHLDSPWRTIQA